MQKKQVILIEDDVTLKNAVESFLKRLSVDVKSFDNVEAAVKVINGETDVILSDVKMPGMSGYDLLKFITKHHPHVPLILMTAYGSIEKAVEAMKQGAYDFLVKPFSLNVLETTLNAAFMDRQSFVEQEKESDSSASPEMASAHYGTRRVSENFLTNHLSMLEIIDNLKRIAPSKASVLIQGESGTGKELIAKMIHEFSPRARRIFVAINCAAMPDTLLESELFGHEKGAFTGAVARQIGKFELSNNGTILLDEISEMSLAMQTKLLRVLQEHEIYRVGGIKPIPLNLRIITTTNRDLYQYMKAGHFREDLFYRINVIPIKVPPLRERADDIAYIAGEFLHEFAVLHGRQTLPVTDTVRAKLMAHPWYGNVRELRNAMERAILVGDFDVINEGGIVSPPTEQASGRPPMVEAGMTLDKIEKKAILATLEECKGNRTRTASRLGISLRTLRNKLKAYGIASEGVNPARQAPAGL